MLARYPPVDLQLRAPGLIPGRTGHTTQAELEAFIRQLAESPPAAAHLSHLVLGRTPNGHDLSAQLLSREGVKTAAALVALGRPIVWLIGQQHGNEPAGGDAMLALTAALADGELTPVLDTISVVIIPRANPDGAAVGERENAAGVDINRDHGSFTQPETRLIHELVRQAPPAVVVDAHEFTVGRRWLETLGGLQAVDLMVLSATHPMTPAPIRALADTLFQPAVEAALAQHKLTSFVYHATAMRAGDRAMSVGGTAPGIARNAFGLKGAVSLLLETRGVGIGRDSYQRRVATHYIAVRAILRTAASSPMLATAIKQPASALPPDIVISHTLAKTTVRVPVLDPITAAEKTATITMADSRQITSTERRMRPAAYAIPAAYVPAIGEQLRLLGVDLCVLTQPIVTPLERYEIIDRLTPDPRAINPQSSLKVRVHALDGQLDAGTLYVPTNQPAVRQLTLALEPDAPGSLSAQTLQVARDPAALALWRIPSSAVDAIVDPDLCPTRRSLAVAP